MPEKTCPNCYLPLEYDEGDPGEPPTLACPMGGAPPSPPAWVCECGYFELDEEAAERRKPRL